MKANKRHPLHGLLVPILDRWAGLYSRWEELRPQILELQRERRAEVMRGDRHRRLARIDRQLAELRAQLPPTQPGWRYIWSDGRVVADAWQEFVSHWRRLQGDSTEPVGPSGGQLAESERTTWEKVIKGKEVFGDGIGK